MVRKFRCWMLHRKICIKQTCNAGNLMNAKSIALHNVLGTKYCFVWDDSSRSQVFYFYKTSTAYGVLKIINMQLHSVHIAIYYTMLNKSRPRQRFGRSVKIFESRNSIAWKQNIESSWHVYVHTAKIKYFVWQTKTLIHFWSRILITGIFLTMQLKITSAVIILKIIISLYNEYVIYNL